MAKVTQQDIQAKIQQANRVNNIGWLDTEKMNKEGIKTSKPFRLTGIFTVKENPFQVMLPKRNKK